MACARSERRDSSPRVDQQGAVMTNPSVSVTAGADHTRTHEAHQSCTYETDKSMAQRLYDKKDEVCPRALCLSQGVLRCSVCVITINCTTSGTAMKRGVVFRGVCILQKLQPDQLNTFKKGLRESHSMLLCLCAVLKVLACMELLLCSLVLPVHFHLRCTSPLLTQAILIAEETLQPGQNIILEERVRPSYTSDRMYVI